MLTEYFLMIVTASAAAAEAAAMLQTEISTTPDIAPTNAGNYSSKVVKMIFPFSKGYIIILYYIITCNIITRFDGFDYANFYYDNGLNHNPVIFYDITTSYHH